MSNKIKIVLSALDSKLLEAWYSFFGSEENVTILECDITEMKCDAIVSPATSFGFMDGGLDLALSKRFGWHIQEKLQSKIKQLPEGELLIGKALVLETHDTHIPLLISAPTMRIPTNIGINTSINAYLAMKAILIAVKNDNRISAVAIPGLCTGTGGMKPIIAAQQMFTAYEEIILEKQPFFKSFKEAQEYHWAMSSKELNQ